MEKYKQLIDTHFSTLFFLVISSFGLFRFLANGEGFTFNKTFIFLGACAAVGVIALLLYRLENFLFGSPEDQNR